MPDEGVCRCKACWTSSAGSSRTEAAKSGSDKLFSKIHLRFAVEGSGGLIPRRGQGANQAGKVDMNCTLTVLFS